MTSADIVRELQAATPVAPQALRRRIRALEAPPAKQLTARFRGRRWVMLALPTAAAAAVAVGAITGAFDSNPQSARDATAPPTEQAPGVTNGATDSAAGSLKAAAPEATTALAPAAGSVTPTTPRLERYAAQLTIEVKDSDAISKASQDAIAAIRALGGYVVTAQVANGETGSASLTFRVPHDRAQDAFVRLQGLGKIVQQNVQIDDLQETADRLDKAIARQRAQLAAVEARLLRTDLDPVERAQLEARRDVLKSQLAASRHGRTQTTNEARVATLQLELRTPDSSLVVPVESPFDRSLGRVVDILALEAVIVATAAAVLLPFALLGGAIWFGRRGLRRRMEHDLLGA
jgi:hypothetical protein